MILLVLCLLPILQATDPKQKYSECGLNSFWTQMKRGRVLDNVFVDTFLRDQNQFQALPDVELNSTCPDHSNLCILFHNDYPCGACVTLGIRNLFDWAKCNTSREKNNPRTQKCPSPEEDKKPLFQACEGEENECLCPTDKGFRVCQTTGIKVVGQHILQVEGCIACINDAADAEQFRNCSRMDQTQLRVLFPQDDYEDGEGRSQEIVSLKTSLSAISTTPTATTIEMVTPDKNNKVEISSITIIIVAVTSSFCIIAVVSLVFFFIVKKVKKTGGERAARMSFDENHDYGTGDYGHAEIVDRNVDYYYGCD